MAIYKNVLDMIGNTPIVQLSRLNTGKSSLFLKLENQNPGGSIKDRTGPNMIEQAEKRGTIHPGQLIVEATAGNTGLGLALASRLKGYKLLLVIPDKMSDEKINHYSDEYKRIRKRIGLKAIPLRFIPAYCRSLGIWSYEKNRKHLRMCC